MGDWAGFTSSHLSSQNTANRQLKTMGRAVHHHLHEESMESTDVGGNVIGQIVA